MNRRGFLAALSAAVVLRRLDLSAFAYSSPVPTGFVPLSELAKRGCWWGNAQRRALIEILSERNYILDDMEWLEGESA